MNGSSLWTIAVRTFTLLCSTHELGLQIKRTCCVKKDKLPLKMNRFTPKFNQPAHQEEKADQKPAIENNIACGNFIMEKSMVIHDSRG